MGDWAPYLVIGSAGAVLIYSFLIIFAMGASRARAIEVGRFEAESEED